MRCGAARGRAVAAVRPAAWMRAARRSRRTDARSVVTYDSVRRMAACEKRTHPDARAFFFCERLVGLSAHARAGDTSPPAWGRATAHSPHATAAYAGRPG